MAAAIGRKRISLRRTSNSKKSSGDPNETRVAQKGHFAVYTTDGGRFEILVSYLGNGVIGDLFMMAEEEFGIPSQGAIMLPLDASSMEHLLSLIGRGLASELEKPLLLSHARCSTNLTADTTPAFPQISVM